MRGFIASAIIVASAAAVAALPHVPFLRYMMNLHSRREPPFAIPDKFITTTDTMQPIAASSAVQPEMERAFRQSFNDLAADRELDERTARKLVLENPTTMALSYYICRAENDCLKTMFTISPNQRQRHQWSRWGPFFSVRYDRNPVSGQIESVDTRILPAISTADRPSPPIPHYAFIERAGKVDLILRAIE